MRITLRSAATLAVLVFAATVGAQWAREHAQARLGAEIAARAAPGDIVMLSSTTCVFCAEARAWFGARRVPFRECFIERDAACAAQYQAQGAPGTPLLLVRGQRQVGFEAARVLAALR